MWLFLVSGSLLYISYFLQIFKPSDNIGHILHCFVSLIKTTNGVGGWVALP